MHHELTHQYFLSIQPQFLISIYVLAPHLRQSSQYLQLLLRLLLYPNSCKFVLVGLLDILDSIPTKNVWQHFATHITLKSNSFAFFFHDLSFSYIINNLALKRLTHHHHILTSNKTVNNYVNDTFSLPIAVFKRLLKIPTNLSQKPSTKVHHTS